MAYIKVVGFWLKERLELTCFSCQLRFPNNFFLVIIIIVKKKSNKDNFKALNLQTS